MSINCVGWPMRSEPFRSLLIRHEQVLFAQSQQSAACNASHKVEARMCRWLLHMRDLAGNDDLTLTQDFLAQMLSVRRPSVSKVANPLQKAGLIKYSRGNIQVLDAKGLQKRACECYGTVKAHYPAASFQLAIKSRKIPLCTEPYPRSIVRFDERPKDAGTM